MVYKYTSSREVIAKIYSDLDVQEELHRITDIREWITEAIEKIGAFDQYVKKVAEFPVINYRVRLPIDFHSMVQCAYSFGDGMGRWVPMRAATGSFECVSDHWHRHHIHNGQPFNISSVMSNTNVMTNLINLVKATYSVGTPITDTEARAIIDRLVVNKGSADSNGIISTLLSMISVTTAADGSSGGSCGINSFEPVYRMNHGFINTNIRNGRVLISYNAIMVDDDDFPMIPDMISYKEAIYWYVTMKLKFPEFLAGRLRGDVYNEIKSNWHIYRKQAYGNCIMPDADAMQSIQNVWLRQVPELGEHDTFFSSVGQAQNIKTHNGPIGHRY